MPIEPFYDPQKTYQDNYEHGPFGIFSSTQKHNRTNIPTSSFLGLPVNIPFGIPAGPLVNARFVKASLDMGFSLPVYKTVRTKEYPCHPWPNILGVDLLGDLTLEKIKKGLTTKNNYSSPLSITNSFGVPSFHPEIWQEDLAEAVTYAGPGQIVIGSFQGTKRKGESIEALIEDFVLGAKLLQETGVKIIEINLSCPNENARDLLCFNTDAVSKILQSIKKEIPSTPLIIKIAYFTSDALLKKLIQKIGGIVEGISAINTLPTEVRNGVGEQALPGKGRLVSGICGEGILWAGLDMTQQLAKLRSEMNLHYSIIGVGGVKHPNDYQHYIDQGADAVMSATGAMWNPLLAQEIQSHLYPSVK